MPLVITDETEYHDMDFSISLARAAASRGIRLGDFLRCMEVREPGRTRCYIVEFSQIRGDGRRVIVSAIATPLPSGGYDFRFPSHG